MDYRRQAIDELRHVTELRTAEKICRDRLAELNDRLQTLKIPSPQTDPVQGGGGNKTEERWLNIIAAKADEEVRYRDVRRRLKRFNVAWAALSDRDKGVLQEWYIQGGSGCAERIASREHCDIRTAYRWRDEAIISYARTYFGAVVD